MHESLHQEICGAYGGNYSQIQYNMYYESVVCTLNSTPDINLAMYNSEMNIEANSQALWAMYGVGLFIWALGFLLIELKDWRYENE